MLYLALMKVLVLPGNPQAEIDSGYSDDYLATSVGRSWAYLGKGRFARPTEAEGGAVMREDL